MEWRKPWNVPSLIATLLIKRNKIMSQIHQIGRNPFADTNPQNVACWHLNMLKIIKQVRRTRHGGSKRGTQNWFQSTRTVTLSCKGSSTSPSSRACTKDRKTILIEQHFKPTCRHSAKIPRRWSANWVMWSKRSCAKLHQKYNVPNVFFVGIKELCTALADNAWFNRIQ